MEATTDLWEIAPESATRVGHPAPFPVELPQAADRALHLRRRRRPRSVHGLGQRGGRRGAHRPALHRLRHRRGLRRAAPSGGSPTSASGLASSRRLDGQAFRVELPAVAPADRPRTSRRRQSARAGRPKSSPTAARRLRVHEHSRRRQAAGSRASCSTSSPPIRPATTGPSMCRARSRPTAPGFAAPTRCGSRWARRRCCTRAGRNAAGAAHDRRTRQGHRRAPSARRDARPGQPVFDVIELLQHRRPGERLHSLRSPRRQPTRGLRALSWWRTRVDLQTPSDCSCASRSP